MPEEGPPPVVHDITISEYWCITEDRDRAVSEDDPDARWLHLRPGDVIPCSEAVRLGICHCEGCEL